MSLDRATACEILGVSRGSSENDIRSAYRHLALKWHPDKHANNDKATEKFQEISAAYKCLTTEDKDAQVLTMDDMFDLFAQIFFDSRAFYNGFAFEHSDDDYDDDSDDDFSWEQVEKNRHFTKKQTEFSYTANRPSASEASKNADELMKEEERQKKNREKRKSKKKRQREKKREETKKQQEEAVRIAEEHRKKEEFLKKAMETAEKAKRQAELRKNSTKSTTPYLDATKSMSTSRVNNNTISNSFNSGRSKPRAQFDSRTKSRSASGRISESSDSDRDEDIAGWDQQSAFFAGAAATASKKMTATPNSKTEKSRKKSSLKGGVMEEAESVRAMNSGQIDSMDPVVLQSRQFAVKGNEMANLGHYSTAIDLFTQAISLDPRDFRFFGNRSFCYDRLQQCESALKDANRAITLAKEWPKGYFRKGRALAGLKRYAEAETAFEHVLKLDKNCEDAVEELHKTRISRLMEMGFNRPQCDAAIRQYGSVQSALDALLINGVEGVSNSFPEDVYISDEEDYITQTIETSKLDARNPLSLRSLWVGNLHSTVSEKELRDRFGQFGEIESLRRLPDRFCAFINYKRPEEAARALDQLQGVEVGGRFLLIKFPDNPIVDGQPRTMVLKKNSTSATPSTSTNTNTSSSSSSSSSHTKAPTSQQQSGKGASSLSSNYNNHADASGDKVTGPVNGNECYFWRTTGCVFGDRCKYKHLVKAKGADLKPWQKVVYD